MLIVDEDNGGDEQKSMISKKKGSFGDILNGSVH